MSQFDLSQALLNAQPGATIQLGPAEYQGPYVINTPLRLQGVGTASVLWAGTGPVLRVRASGVHLEALSLEVTSEQDGMALLIEAEAESHPPTFSGVHLRGRAVGVGRDGHWRIPTVIDFGQVVPGHSVCRTIGLDLRDPPQFSSELAGLRITSEADASGRWVLQLELNNPEFRPGTLLDGLLDVSAGGLSSQIRLTGQVVAAFNGRATLPKGDPSSAEQGTRAAAQSRARLTADLLSQPSGTRTLRPTARPVRESPPTPQAQLASLLSRAAADEQQGDHDQAIQWLRQAAQLAPQDTQPRVELAKLYHRLGDFESARAEWEQIIALDPQTANAYLELATCLNQLNRFAETIRIIEVALRDPQVKRSAETYQALAMAYAHLERYGEAVWALDQAQQIRLNPKLVILRQRWADAAAVRRD